MAKSTFRYGEGSAGVGAPVGPARQGDGQEIINSIGADCQILDGRNPRQDFERNRLLLA
jgi:hypothetical protein